MDNVKKDLTALLAALNTVEVKGASVKIMANCMVFTEQMIDRLNKNPMPAKQKKGREDEKQT